MIGPIGDPLADAGSEELLAYRLGRDTYEELVRPALQAFKLRVVRADEISEPGDIPQQIFLRLRDADLVIADLTTGNPNVLYELGLRHSQGKVTIQIGERGKLPFDITTIRTLQFVRSADGYAAGKAALIDMIRAAFDEGMSPVTSTRVFRRSDARARIAPAGVDVVKSPSLVTVKIDIESARAQISHHIGSLSDGFRAWEKIQHETADTISRGRSTHVDPGPIMRDLRHRMDPVFVQMREDITSIERNIYTIDRAFNIGLSLIILPRDRATLLGWKRLFTRFLTLKNLSTDTTGAFSLLSDKLPPLFSADDIDVFLRLGEISAFPAAWLREIRRAASPRRGLRK